MHTTIRHLETLEEYEAAVELQYATWGPNFTGCVPASLLRVTQRIGAVTAGAFTESGELAGCVYGITGIQNGAPIHWSDILAVDHRYRGLGLGKRLKWFQRTELLKAGVKIVQWSYDPLLALNANLNLNTLGARPVEYIENMYGDTRSDLHAGLGTDRFVVQWDLDAPHVEALAEGRPTPTRTPVDVPVVNTTVSAKTPAPHEDALPDSASVIVEIPASINAAKQAFPGAGEAWRRCTRRALMHYLSSGYRVTRFAEFAAGRFGYVLKRDR